MSGFLRCGTRWRRQRATRGVFFMHEMSLAESVLQLIEDAARQQDFSRVSLVRLEIGQLAGVEVESLRFCFDAVTRGSLAEGAALDIVAKQGAGWCEQCSDTVALSETFGACPQCGGSQVRVTGGTELRVRELEVS
jgi:hydrogenase nickel incorporation protein HypA/HybF